MNFRDVGGAPITTALDLRISLWDTYDVRVGDIDEAGLINTSALHYGGYQTTLTITPDENGNFLPWASGYYQLDLLSLVDFPTILGTNNYFLQLEYKNVGSSITTYQIYDFVFDPPWDNMERMNLIDTYVSYSTADAGPRTNYNTFTLDANNNASSAVTLKFGETLSKTLLWSKTNSRFEFNSSVNIAGVLTGLTGLTSTGTINFSAAIVGIGTATPGSAFQVADGYYAQFSDQNSGAPPAGDCDADTEFGRISSDVTNHRLYICQGASRGWDWVDLND